MIGLAKVEQRYRDRSSRAKELRKQGKKIVGYFCCLTPVEIFTAADLVPYRIMGNAKEDITKADAYMEIIACPYVRSSLDLALRNQYDFLDGFVLSHSCDNIVKLYDIWRHNVKPAYAHFINVPHTLSRPSHEFLLEEMKTFKRSVEKLIARELTTENLNEAIKIHNENRALVRELYKLRKKDPPLISGSEVIKTLVCVMSLPVKESNELLKEVIEDAKGRTDGPHKKSARFLIYGSEIDCTDFIDMVEETGANVVMDDLSIGSRPFWHDVEISDEPLRSLADRYLEKITCPRFCRGPDYGTHEDDLEARFGHLHDFTRDFDVNGVILHLMRYCDTFAFDIPDVKEFLGKEGLPVLEIEDEYVVANIPKLKLKVQAFLEMIS